jgi:hypothetical protein
MLLWWWFCWSWQRHRAGPTCINLGNTVECRLPSLRLLTLTFEIIDRSEIEQGRRCLPQCGHHPIPQQPRAVERLAAAVVTLAGDRHSEQDEPGSYLAELCASPGICIRPEGSAPTQHPPAHRAGLAMTRQTRLRPSQYRCGIVSGPADDHRLEARPDVLTFTSEPQAADLEVIGRVRMSLYVEAPVYIDMHDPPLRCHPAQSINISDGIVRARLALLFPIRQLGPGPRHSSISSEAMRPITQIGSEIIITHRNITAEAQTAPPKP